MPGRPLALSPLCAATFAALAITALAPPRPATAATRPFTVVTRDYFVSRIGPYRPAQNPRLSAAIRAFGRPSRRTLVRSTCRVDWGRLRLRINFENFGGAGE